MNITRENINSHLYYLEWAEEYLHHFEDLIRNVFLPVLSLEQPSGLNYDKLMELLHKIMACSTVMSGKLEVHYTIMFSIIPFV